VSVITLVNCLNLQYSAISASFVSNKHRLCRRIWTRWDFNSIHSAESVQIVYSRVIICYSCIFCTRKKI